MNVEWTPAALDDLADFYVALSLAEQDDISRTVLRVNAELSPIRKRSASRGRRTAAFGVSVGSPSVTSRCCLPAS